MFLGMKPFLIISDADLLKDINVKHFDKFANRVVSNSIYQYFVGNAILDLIAFGNGNMS